MPTLTGSKVRSYLPLLTYTDLSEQQALAALREQGGRSCQIRVVSDDQKTIGDHDMVTMRIDISKPSLADIYGNIARRLQRYINGADKQLRHLRVGTESRLIGDFYHIFSEVMHRLGTPVFSKTLFALLPEKLDTRYYVMYEHDSAVAAAVVIYDNDIAWVPWSGTASDALAGRPALPMYWAAIQDSYASKKALFDFGRSPYGRGTYEFKTRWGALPVRVDVVSQQRSNVYSKYEVASQVWRRLPRAVSDTLGPALCRHLPEL